MRHRKKRPLIGIITHTHRFGSFCAHYAYKKYVLPLNRNDMASVLLPRHEDKEFYRSMADRFDGFLFTGSESNLDPDLYGGVKDDCYGPFDPERDEVSFSLFENALKHEKPFIAICRGVQDLNVFLGGTLNQALCEREEGVDHHLKDCKNVEDAYFHRHDAHVKEGTLLHDILNETHININSVHHQGIDKIADELTVNALSHDGVVEAVNIENNSGCALGVQWHPEHDFSWNDQSEKIFKRFSNAAYQQL